MQPKLRLVVLSIAVSLLVVLVDPASAQEAPEAPMVGACLPGSGYASGCDVDQDGDIDIFDIQLTAGHWGQVGIWSSGSWDLTGNAGTTPGTHFLGTTDMEALELRVAGQRALRLEPIPSPPDGTPAGGASAPNVIGGHEDNVVTTYVQGAAIGGGSAGFGHEVFDNFGVIGGGGANAGYVGIGNAVPRYPLHMASGAHVTTGGVWTNASSRALKVDFATVDRAALLQTLSTLPIATWSYRAEGAGVRHLGPTAEDFYAAFGLGDSGAAIGTVDADGVALAAA